MKRLTKRIVLAAVALTVLTLFCINLVSLVRWRNRETSFTTGGLYSCTDEQANILKAEFGIPLAEDIVFVKASYYDVADDIRPMNRLVMDIVKPDEATNMEFYEWLEQFKSDIEQNWNMMVTFETNIPTSFGNRTDIISFHKWMIETEECKALVRDHFDLEIQIIRRNEVVEIQTLIRSENKEEVD